MLTLPVIDATPCCTASAAGLMAAERAERLAAAFKVLGDPVRLRVLVHIAEAPDATACACHLPTALGISQPTLSHHMKKLVEAGFVTREQRGRWAHYTVVTERFAELSTYLTTATGTAAPAS